MPIFNGNETAVEIAEYIFMKFEVGQSTAIRGFTCKVGSDEKMPKGELVLEFLKEHDRRFNVTHKDGKKPRRKRVMLPNTIGGYVAQKIFKWEQRIMDNMIIISIWRIQ